MHNTLRFVSGNEFKLKEAAQILEAAGITVVSLQIPISELQVRDTDQLVKDKTLKAFRRVGRPLFVEHTGLYLAHLSGLPGGLTQIFWDTLQAERFAEMFGRTNDPTAVAKTVIGYTDGRQFKSFEGEISGKIASEPRGPADFQWDCVFIPEGHNKTFAELGTDIKNRISMRRIALDRFVSFLEGKEV